MSGTKPATLAQRIHAKDWDSIKEHHRENILANEAMTREALAEELAHNLMKKQQLGEKLTRWSQLVGQAAGVDPAVTLGDDEAEALLVGWATVGRFKPSGWKGISTTDVTHGDGSLETQLDQLIELTRAIVKWAGNVTDRMHAPSDDYKRARGAVPRSNMRSEDIIRAAREEGWSERFTHVDDELGREEEE